MYISRLYYYFQWIKVFSKQMKCNEKVFRNNLQCCSRVSFTACFWFFFIVKSIWCLLFLILCVMRFSLSSYIWFCHFSSVFFSSSSFLVCFLLQLVPPSLWGMRLQALDHEIIANLSFQLFCETEDLLLFYWMNIWSFHLRRVF